MNLRKSNHPNENQGQALNQLVLGQGHDPALLTLIQDHAQGPAHTIAPERDLRTGPLIDLEDNHTAGHGQDPAIATLPRKSHQGERETYFLLPSCICYDLTDFVNFNIFNISATVPQTAALDHTPHPDQSTVGADRRYKQ